MPQPGAGSSVRRAGAELVLLAGVYVAYSVVRNRFGSARTSPEAAFRNAQRVIEIEDSLGLYFELALQDLFIDATAFIQFWNLYYGLFHFLVTAGVLIWAFVALEPSVYRWWRRTLLAMTVIALGGYASFPLMPPRLLASCGPYGACHKDPEARYIDTVTELGGIWSFESDAVESITNHYAAMPSLHVGWALWVAALGLGWCTNRWMRAGAGMHLVCTIFGVIVTANHYWLDAIGGLGAFVVGVGIAKGLSKLAVGTFRPANAELSS